MFFKNLIAKKGKVIFPNPYAEAEELLFMFYYAVGLDFKKEIHETLINHLRKEMLHAYAPICEKCDSWSLYHDCDDPEVLPENRLKKEPDNCSNYLCNNHSCPNNIKA